MKPFVKKPHKAITPIPTCSTARAILNDFEQRSSVSSPQLPRRCSFWTALGSSSSWFRFRRVVFRPPSRWRFCLCVPIPNYCLTSVHLLLKFPGSRVQAKIIDRWARPHCSDQTLGSDALSIHTASWSGKKSRDEILIPRRCNIEINLFWIRSGLGIVCQSFFCCGI